MLAQIDRDYGFDENDVIESNESFMIAMKEVMPIQISQISQIDRDYGFDENDIIESNESFMIAMKEIENRDMPNNEEVK